MLDIDFIKENSDVVKKAIEDKGIDLNLDRLLELDQKRRELIQKVDKLRQERNEVSSKRDIERGKEIKLELASLENELKEAKERFLHLMSFVPNIPYSDSPIGKDSNTNKEIKKQGNVPQFDFKVKDHIELGKLLDIIDFESGVKVSGFRGYYLKNEGAVLHFALLNFGFSKIQKMGFTPFVPPTLVHEEVLFGSGHFPFGKDNIYQIANPGKLQSGEDIKTQLFLTGTSESSLLAYFMDKTIPEEELPIKLCAMTHCYRSEVGDYGKDTRGLFRVHEFDKVEQVVICKNDLKESEKHFEEMLSLTESILADLELATRQIETSTGDMGAGKYRMVDLEVWMPGRNSYGEICSNSNLTDWQARRLNMKYEERNKETLFPFTLNSTVVPSPRLLIAILENFQQEDGSVKIPEVLVPYTGFDKISPKN